MSKKWWHVQYQNCELQETVKVVSETLFDLENVLGSVQLLASFVVISSSDKLVYCDQKHNEADGSAV